VGPHDPVLVKSLLLAAIHFVEGIVWLSVVAGVVDRGRAFIASPRARRTLEGVAGAVLIGFGVRLATDTSR
jgi:threonine/homoserine/homoserine lactone efflux protein